MSSLIDSPSFPAFAEECIGTQSPLRNAISNAYRHDEKIAVLDLLKQIYTDPVVRTEARTLAHKLVETIRIKRSHSSGVDALMHEFSLSSEEGVALMCLAEALLRIPDRQTADRLIADKIGHGDWRSHLGASPSLFVNAATWGLLLTGKLVGNTSEQSLGITLTHLIGKGG
ncbi:MAG TPA: trifunctional transcriptional regulator/proline dehydrogenase/L-glutamate gamma-semialdehyde dehydrogenase, partial [Herminiimonas sp.]|nr:trifunctional transcriptional regulator/proline dehydrogenase/L-glutamate gamma-semialdehyde dehydrogenase [Herminiimonas sp.]